MREPDYDLDRSEQDEHTAYRNARPAPILAYLDTPPDEPDYFEDEPCEAVYLLARQFFADGYEPHRALELAREQHGQESGDA